MYFKPLDQVMTHFNELHFDLSKAHESMWKGKPVYVLGTATDDEKLNQLWIDKDKLVALRYFKFDTNGKMEATFEEHKMIEGAWSETLCKFYMNDKLLQTEVYHDIQANKPIAKSVFNPAMIGK